MTHEAVAELFDHPAGYLAAGSGPRAPRAGRTSGFDDRAPVHEPDEPVGAPRQIEVVGGDDERDPALGLEARE